MEISPSRTLKPDLAKTSSNMSDWSIGLFHCGNCGNCIRSFFCPCTVYGDVTSELGAKHSPCACSKTGCCFYFFCCIFFPPCLPYLACQTRQSIRNRDAIPGGCCSDCICATCCHCCTLAQQYHHIRH